MYLPPARVLLCFLVVLVTTLGFAQSPRAWKSADGKFSVQATFVAVDGESVQLKRADTGKQVKVPLAVLSDADRAFVAELSNANPGPQPNPNSAVDTPAKNTPAVSIQDAQPQDIAIQAISDMEYRLFPFGTIEIPADGMVWKLASRKPPVFIAQKPDDPQAFIMTVAQPAGSQAERVANIKAVYNQLVTQMKAGGIANMRGDKLDLSGPIADSFRFGLMGQRADGTESHFATEFLFNEQFTCIFQATSPLAENTAFFMENVKSFVPAGAAPDGGSNVPDDVAQSVGAAIAKLQKQLADDDVDGLLQSVMPPDVYQSMKADESKWADIVKSFRERKAPELAGLLKQLDFAQATYDAETKSIKFPVGRRGMEFKNVGGKWTLQN
ncbi:MAG: SHD1 domain-containing protein [Rubripirellula sp.]